MSLIYKSIYLFYHFKFPFSPSQTAVIHRHVMSDTNSSDLNLLDYHVWEQCWSFIARSNQSQKTVSEFKDALQLVWSASITRESH